MNSTDIQEAVYQWALSKDFDAPYGVLTGEGSNIYNRKYKSVTFGKSRIFDATIYIYNKNFILAETSHRKSFVFKTYDELQNFLNEL